MNDVLFIIRKICILYMVSIACHSDDNSTNYSYGNSQIYLSGPLKEKIVFAEPQ